MITTLNILLAGPPSTEMDLLGNAVAQLPNAKAKTKVLGAGGGDFEGDPDFKTDLLVLFLGPRAEEQLAGLGRLPPQVRPITLIVCEPSVPATPQLMRLSMHAGARDFIMGQQVVDDAMAAIRKVLKEELARNQKAGQSLTVVVDAKGGAGASTVASGLAHAFSVPLGMRTLLLDLDFQFGSQCLSLDLHPQQGLMEALGALESLDEIALTGYVAQHASGLHLLSCMTKQVILPGEVNETRLSRLLDLIHRSYEQVVVDLPRLIDPVFSMVLDRADHVLVVLQQDLTNLRDAQRLTYVMLHELAIPASRVKLVVNRFNANGSITLADVEQALGFGPTSFVPNDFERLQKATNLGIPLAEYAPQSPATRSILKLAAAIAGKADSQGKGSLRRFFSRLIPGG